MGKKILLIDNYDSFTYNLFQYCRELGAEVEIYKNDEITLQKAKKIFFTHLIISPGPGNPEIKRDIGNCKEILNFYKEKLPILGVCMGQEVIVSFFGGKVVKAKKVMHGKQSRIFHTGAKIFKKIPQNILVMRYHSLLAEEKSLPSCLEILARTEENEIMAMGHKIFPIFGVQFHPESIGTEFGKSILKNFLEIN